MQKLTKVIEALPPLHVLPVLFCFSNDTNTWQVSVIQTWYFGLTVEEAQTTVI